MQQQSYGGVSAGGPGGSNSNNNSNNLANDVLTLVEATIMLDLTVDNIETVLWVSGPPRNACRISQLGK